MAPYDTADFFTEILGDALRAEIKLKIMVKNYVKILADEWL